MEFIFRSRWVNLMLAFGDSDKDDGEFIAIDNTGGSFEFAPEEDSDREPEESEEFGFRSTHG